MPSEGSGKVYKEPTVKCQNCGALVPPALRECFICDERMPAAPVTPIGRPIAMAEPTKSEIETAEEAFRKLEEEIPLDEEILPWGKEAGAGEQLTEDRIIDLMLEFERELAPTPAKAEAARRVIETSVHGEEDTGSETSPAMESRSHKGLAIASAGGFVYAISLILFVPLLGNIVAAILIVPAAFMIVGGSNIALKEGAKAGTTGRFSCPLCGHEFDEDVEVCENCGAKF